MGDTLLDTLKDGSQVTTITGSVSSDALTDAQLRASAVPVSVSAIALPTGASTSAAQDTGNNSLASIDGKITAVNTGAVVVSSSALPSGAATETTLSALNAKVTAVNTGAVVVSSSALPSGAASASGQTTQTGHLSDIEINTEATVFYLDAAFTDGYKNSNAGGASAVNIQDGGNSITVDGTVGATQSGTWNVTNVSGTVSLPTGAATETTLAALNTKVTAVNTGAVVVSSSALPSGAATAALQTQPGVDIGDVTINNAAGASAVNIQDGGNSITVDGTLGATQSGTWNITNVSGTVSLPTGAATETTLAALSAKHPATLGQKTMANSMAVTLASDQSTINVSAAEASVLFKGRASTFNTPGRAGTTGQKILSLHNATGSAVTVKVTKVVLDLACTVVKAVTVPPPMVRLWKVTVLPTNGTALTKNKIGGTTTSSASVTTLGDASADGTGSASTLTATLPAGAILTQEYAPRIITAAGYEAADRMEFLGDTTITLAALEGVVLFLDYTVATQNPTTDRWIASIEWTET